MQHSFAPVTNCPWSQGPATCVTKPDYENAILNRYFAEYVPVDEEKSDLISQKVIPLVKQLLAEINAQDKRFGKEAVRVGSSTQGLSVNTKGDFDFSVVFKLNPSEDANHPSNKLSWTDQPSPKKYGFADSDKNDTSSLRKDLEIVREYVSLPHPGAGYLNIHLQWPYSGLVDLQCDGDLLPYLVNCRFKDLLQDALDKFGHKGQVDDLKLLRDAHGPALTLQTKVTTSDGKTHPVSIDLAVIIQAGLKFQTYMGWPGQDESWPQPTKVMSIMKKGIDVVAKKPFFWQMSFVELEKELVSEIDKDGGCRKKVHRIMKSVFYNVCKEKPVLTSYMLKNVWFLECEKYPDSDSWQPEHLAEGYYSCLESLREYARQGKLRQYFHRSVNLLEGKDVRKDVVKIINFDFEKAVNKKREAEDVPVLQPPWKIPRVLFGNWNPMSLSWR